MKYMENAVRARERGKSMMDFPDKLRDLPVPRSIRDGDIHLDENMVLIAHTGSGKSMSIPPCVALTQEKKVILRQPTRQTTKSTYLGLKMFWGDRLSIGMHTSDETHGSLDECDIMVVTDGVMKNWLKSPKYDVCVIFDEYHSQLPITEVEAGIVKTYLAGGAQFQIILLSATIRPSNIVKYFETLNPNPVDESKIDRICDILEEGGEEVNTMVQDQWLKIRYSEGVAYPIEDRITEYKMDISDKNPGTVFDFCKRMLEEEKRGLIFACTRREIQELCNDVRKYYPDLPAEFAHADVDIKRIIEFVEQYEPCVIFATVALATSVTLPFDEVLIIDKGIDTVWEHGIEKQVTDIPIENNGVLQRRGRCFAAGTPIITSTGYKPIEQIKKGDSILTINEDIRIFEWKPVAAVHQHNASELITVRSKRGTILKCTPNHPVLSHISDRTEWMEISKARHAISLIKAPKTDRPTPTPLELLCRADTKKRIYVVTKKNQVQRLLNEIKCKKGITEAGLSDLYLGNSSHARRFYKWKKNNILPLWVWDRLPHEYKDRNAIIGYKSHNGKVNPLSDELTEDIMWLAGLISTDGTMYDTRIKVTNKDPEIIKKTVDILHCLTGRTPSRYQKKSGRVVDIEISSAPLNILIRAIVEPGEYKTRDVKLKPTLFEMSDKQIASFLGGCFDGDGSLYLKKLKEKKPSKHTTADYELFKRELKSGETVENASSTVGISYSHGVNWSHGNHLPIRDGETSYRTSIRIHSASTEFLRGMRLLLFRLGIKNSIVYDSISNPNPERKIWPKLKMHELRVDNKVFFERFLKRIPVIKFQKADLPYFRKGRVQQKQQESSYYKEALEVINKKTSECPVYNLTVYDNNNYIAEDIIVHNCGRIKPGICTLATPHRDSWDEIIPEAVVPPLSKTSPEHVVMVCAQYEVDARGIDILSDLPMYDIERSVKRLKWLDLVYEDESTLKLTVLGKRVNALPLDINTGVMVAQCPKELLPAVVAIASFDQGVFNLFKGKIELIDGTKAEGKDIFDRSMVHPRSILLTKANILKEAFAARSEMNPSESLRTWADANGMWSEKMKKVMWKFYQITTRGLSKSERTLRKSLMEFDMDSHGKALIDYLTGLKVFEQITLHYDQYQGKDGWKGDYRGYFCILDGLDIDLLGLEDEVESVTCLGTPKLIKTRSGNSIAIWGDTTIVEIFGREVL
ncbi:MAG: DEAD/DEAH box helicase [Candidatus Altiarchaeales archaeon]|nr:DEAD/DEAH box helicase [Candidatus Altiarchaeales archaeon]